MEKIKRIFKIKDLRNKVLFILGLLIVYRILASVPVPGVDSEALEKFLNQGSGVSRAFQVMNVFSGGGISNFSLALLGLSPYITASIVMQLLTMIFPRLEELYKEEGEQGRMKFNQYTRYLAVPLAILNAIGYIALFKNQYRIITDVTFLDQVGMVAAIVASSLFIMWLGELMTEKKLGNGISLIIFAGIVSRIPSDVANVIKNYNSSNLIYYVVFVLMFLLIVAGVVFITEAQRNVPITYAKRMKGSKLYGGTSTYLPLRVNQVGVIPIIFAMSIMLFPVMIANFLGGVEWQGLGDKLQSIAEYFQPGTYIYMGLTFILVVLFTYFYTSITFEPNQISENLQKQGGFIPGIRPGKHTAKFLGKTINRIIFAGAIFLGFIAVLPVIIDKVVPASSGLSNLAIGGTSLLIMVSVALETVKQIDSQLVIREYDEI